MANKGTGKLQGLDFHHMSEQLARYEKLGVEIKPIVEEMLELSHEEITQRIIEATVPNKFPAHGKYSQGGTAETITRKAYVRWEGASGLDAYVPVGYDLRKNMSSLYLMYGTPRHQINNGGMPAVPEMYEAIWGRKTRTQLRKIQQQTFKDLIDEALSKKT